VLRLRCSDASGCPVRSGPSHFDSRRSDGAPWEVGLALPVMAGFLGIPVAVGIAILRYGLYNIDVIINRTLVYGSLTALLAGGYFGTIMALQGISSLALQVPVRTITGQEQPSQLVVVVSTLAKAALFGPLRRGTQAFIDRRFSCSNAPERLTARS
jgi:hypothetical protein